MAKRNENPNGIQELKKAIREKSIQRLYIFHGEETFLLSYYVQQLKKLLVDPLTESFNFQKLTKETFDMLAFADAVESLPMMSENTFIWVDDIDIFKFNEQDRTRLTEVLEDIPDYCTILFTYETAEWKPDKRLKKLWNAIDENATIVEFARQDQRDLITWVTRHFAANQKSIDPNLCSYLIDITGGTMTALAGEISKISSYSGSSVITKSDIDAVTEPVLDAVVFQMTDMLGEGKYEAALLKLQQLLKMQQEPIAILGAIGNHFRRLGVARTLLDNGRNSGELMRLCGISEYPAKKLMGAFRSFSAAFCAHATEIVMETDRKLKTSYDDPDRLLEMLILELAREARNG